MIRVTAAVLLCLIATATLSPAAASIPCWAVKAAVASYGVAGAVALARNHGYTDAEIAEARRCLRK